MNRRRSFASRFRARFYGFSGDPFALRCHFLTDGNPDAGGAASGADKGAGGGQQPPPADVIPRAEAAKAFKDRDAAKQAAKKSQAIATLLASKLGIDVSDLELVETGNADNPFDLKGDALEQVTTTLTAAQQAKVDAQRKAGKWEDREKELNDAWTKKLQKSLSDAERAAGQKVDGASKKLAALEQWIDETAGAAPLREALAAENAVHDGTGNYDDLVALLKPRVKREIAIDEETGKAAVTFTALAEDGTPLTDGKGNPASVRTLVGEWLAKRPHLKQARMGRGPGAGGKGPIVPGGAAMKSSDRGTDAARRVFGESFVPKA